MAKSTSGREAEAKLRQAVPPDAEAEESRGYPDPDYNNLDGTVADMSVDREHVTDGSPCWCGPVTEPGERVARELSDLAADRESLVESTVTQGGFELLPDEPESRPKPPARGKHPKLLQSLLAKGLAPGKPAMSIRVPEGEKPLLVAEGLKREGRRLGASPGWVEGQEWLRFPWYVEAWAHPTKDRIVQVLAKEGVAPYTKKPKGAAE